MALNSFIEPGGQRMQVIVRAGSPGQAIAAAQNYREWLLEHQLGRTQATPLAVLEADPSGQRGERSAHA